MDNLVEEMQTYYQRRAPVYDASMKYDLNWMVSRLDPAIAQLKQLMAGRRALEIACGPCFWTNFVSETAVSILATDYNQETLEQARQKDLNWEKIALQVADAYNLNTTISQRFDAAYAVDWFAHVPRSRFAAFLQGLHAQLTSGARVAFCDQLPSRPASKTGIYDDEGNHLQERMLPDGSRYRVIKHYLSDSDLHEIFSPYSNQIDIVRLPECRRIIVSYTI